MTLKTPLFLREHEGQWISVLGMPVRLLAGKSVTGGAYCVSVSVSPPDSITPPEVFDFAAGFFVLEAPEMAIRAGNTLVGLSQGDYLHVASGVGRQTHNESDQHTRLLTICLPSGYDDYLRRIGQPIPPNVEEMPQVPDNIEETMMKFALRYGINLQPDEALAHATPKTALARTEPASAPRKNASRVRHLVDATMTDGAYELDEVTLGPDAKWKLEPDESKAPRMLFFLEGTGMVHHDFSGWAIEPEAAAFVAPEHRVVVYADDDGARLLSLRVL